MSLSARVQVSLIHVPIKKLEVPKGVTVLEFDRYLFLVFNESFNESKLKSIKNFLLGAIARTGARHIKLSIEVEAFPERIRKISIKECADGSKYIENLLSKVRSELSKRSELKVIENSIFARSRTARGILKMGLSDNTLVISTELEFDCVGSSVRGVLIGGLDVSTESGLFEDRYDKLVTYMLKASSILARG